MFAVLLCLIGMSTIISADTIKTKLGITFHGGFNSLCNHYVMDSIDRFALNSTNKILAGTLTQESDIHFDSVSVEDESLSNTVGEDSHRELDSNAQRLQFDWNIFAIQMWIMGRCSACYKEGIDTRAHRNLRRSQEISDDFLKVLGVQLSQSLSEFIHFHQHEPTFECLSNVSHVEANFIQVESRQWHDAFWE